MNHDQLYASAKKELEAIVPNVDEATIQKTVNAAIASSLPVSTVVACVAQALDAIRNGQSLEAVRQKYSLSKSKLKAKR